MHSHSKETKRLAADRLDWNETSDKIYRLCSISNRLNWSCRRGYTSGCTFASYYCKFSNAGTITEGYC